MASTTAQRVSSMGVAWVSTTEPSPSPRDDGHHDGARIRAVKARVHLDGEAPDHGEGDPHRDLVVLALDDPQALEGVRVVVHAVPGIEPVGEQVLRAAAGLEAHDGVDVARGPHGQQRGRSVGASPASSSRTQTSTPSSCTGSGRQAPWGLSPSSSPCHGHTSRPLRTQPAARDAPMCGQASGAAISPFGPCQKTSSRSSMR